MTVTVYAVYMEINNAKLNSDIKRKYIAENKVQNLTWKTH